MRPKIPTVSVLLCVYNGERYLREAVDSILAQTWTDFEFVIVDDASTDKTPAILDSYRDGRIVRYRNAENIGLTKSLNRGLEICRGEYVARIDADDVSLPDRLARQVAFLAEHPEITVLGTWTTEIDEHGGEIGAFEVAPDADYVAWELTWRNVVYPSSVLMRRAPVAALCGYDARVPYAQDHDLWTRVIMAGGKAALLPERLTRYRRTAGQITCTHASEQDECGLGVRQRYLRWILGRDVPIEQIDAMRRILGDEFSQTIPQFSGGLSLLHEVRRWALRHSSRAAQQEIRRTISHALRRRAVIALYHENQPAIAAQSLLAAVRSAPALLLETRTWRRWAGVAKAGAFSVFSPRVRIAGTVDQ